jgi:hypothetical protein
MMLPRQLTGVCERDIDLLLLEEFVASPGFLNWFLGRVGLPEGATLRNAERSVATTTGESDLELTLEIDSRLIKVLIENKVDAMFQPRQPERYRERADGYVRHHGCHAVVTVLLGPEQYFVRQTDHFGFDQRVTYESVLDWFQEAEHLGARALHKCALLLGAIDRARTGWQLVPDESVTAFWLAYWELAASVAPELRMPKPSAKPRTSSFIHFRPLALAQAVTLVHKVPYGKVDLQLSGQGGEMGSLHARWGNTLGPRMELERANKSAAVRITVAPIDLAAPFKESESNVREALAAALELLRWYTEVFDRAVAD